METVRLSRLETSDHGTFGRLRVRDLSFYTGELPWRDNAKGLSCIPAGTYGCAWTYSPKFKRMMYLVHPVPGRAGVRIHFANYMGDVRKGLRSHLEGCIGLGEKVGVMDGQKALLVSKPAVRRFEDLMGGKNFTLEVIQPWA